MYLYIIDKKVTQNKKTVGYAIHNGTEELTNLKTLGKIDF